MFHPDNLLIIHITQIRLFKITDTTTLEVLSRFYLNNKQEQDRSFWGEEDIIVASSAIISQNQYVSYSDFGFVLSNNAYVAGINGLQLDSFDTASYENPDQHEFFYHTTSSFHTLVVDAEKSER